ncbi:anti sigma factor C-terminal domain-containing protein [Paenibacillus donghaensis]|uniref:Sigma factor regulator C-terminal domain-containing protein n=1 Tax=Paenibacillus donghaensis TaxID=414771 RepID=A0A2Z2K9M4_9BACL|nr:anti sigma factor C-terminal domain-containing protein [Paenibacillus donghaensis]ASA22204.1 hypothetical protein B9T62_16295 [Paenibacillus donghaensis]
MTAPWEEKEDQQLAQTLKKAKRRSMFRSISISFIVSIVTLIVVFFGAAQLVERQSREAHFSEQLYMSISSPNEYESGFKDNRGFLSGVLEINTYKIIENVPIPWQEKWFNYNEWWFPFATGAYGGISNLTVKGSGYQENEELEYHRQYNPYNGQKEMAYYVPDVDYNGKILNDLPAITQMGNEKLAELALSFNKDYSFDEVKNMLPAGIKPVWYWVDTYDDPKGFDSEPHKDGVGKLIYPRPLSSSFGVYGFRIRPDTDQVEPKDFIGAIQYGLERKDNYYSEYKRISKYLSPDNSEPKAENIRILGVVVTGTPASLSSLNGQTYIRGAALGAVVDKY